MSKVPVILPDGTPITLSPGGQNVIIKEVVEEFLPRWVRGAHVVYIGDTGDKWGVFEPEVLADLGVVVQEHGKMPDVIAFDTERGWLVVVEAVESHGPMNAKRRDELRELLAGATVPAIYVTAFLDKSGFKKFSDDIAWETEVWVAEDATHLIHYDGEKFLEPYEVED